MYYERLNTNVTDSDPVVVVEAKNSCDEVVYTHIKIEEVVEDVRDDKSVRSVVSRAPSSLEQEVLRSIRTVQQTTTYNPTTGKAAKSRAVQK